jgi:hypothetical protein
MFFFNGLKEKVKKVPARTKKELYNENKKRILGADLL